MSRNKNEIIRISPIGVIHSIHKKAEATPIQPVFAEGCTGTAEIFPEYAEGLKDIDGFSHIILLFHFHEAEPVSLVVKPYLDDELRGVFATRHPRRPNAVGMSTVKLLKREDNILYLEDIDILDGTPIIDIKPYLPKFDSHPDAKAGWTVKISPETAAKLGKRDYKG